MHNCVHILTDAFALASAALDKDSIEPPRDAVANNALFNVWVIDGNGVRTLVRENVSAQLSNALVRSANHGAKVQGSPDPTKPCRSNQSTDTRENHGKQ